MRAFAIQPDAVTAEAVESCVLCQDMTVVGEFGRVRLVKGHVVTSDDVPALRTFGSEIHLIRMDHDDVHEDKASLRLATAVAGPGIYLKGPNESQVHMRSEYRGLLEVRVDVLERINCVPDISVFATYDGRPVEADQVLGACKVTPLVVSNAVLREAEDLAREDGPVLSVRAFAGRSVGVIVRDRIAGTTRDKFESAIAMKVGWFGSTIAGISYLPDDIDAIGDSVQKYLSDGVGLLLAAGVNSTDPLDLTIQALDRVGAHTEKRGVPAHPGSTCWLAYVGDVPVFGLALCGMFSRTTVLDLLLPQFLVGKAVRAADLAQLGHGGLLGKDMSFRFPPYSSGDR